MFRAGPYIGLGPEYVKSGDIIIIPIGSRVPFVARRVGDGRYELLGEVFV